MTSSVGIVPPPALARAGQETSSVVRDSLILAATPGILSFSGGFPAPELFDVEGLRASYDHVLRTAGRRALQYSATEGDPDLRAAIAARLASQGFAADPDRIVITTGAQQGLSLLAGELLGPGDTVLVENPTYVSALQSFAAVRARAVPVATDEQGIVVEALADAIRRERPAAIYLVPNFQNPAGHTLPAARRAAVAELAAAHGLWIVEDDPYAELRFDGAPRLPRISGYPAVHDRSILVGSLSKLLAPGMRLGWLHAPAPVHRAVALAKQAADMHSSTVDQAAAAHYLATHDLDAHLTTVRHAYRERAEAMLAGLAAALPEGSHWSHPAGGMFIWARLPDGHDTAALLPKAVAAGVAYVPGAPFYVGTPDPATLRLSFITNQPSAIRTGMARLSTLF
ncbi:PLP-dependent aminotransferase family protein [Dactylosporangium sp. CA-092794]|uniref:aminotransferase-like domain-containing protein n=1 Tax=Dactylosporangium sp. CA-092794 TaxID=3239929 RepID=UPI003D91E129